MRFGALLATIAVASLPLTAALLADLPELLLGYPAVVGVGALAEFVRSL